MGLWDMFKKSAEPYKDSSINQIYNLLFCDNLDLYKTQTLSNYPWDVLFSDTSTALDLQKVVDDRNVETRVKILACNRQTAIGYKIEKKEVLAVIVEVALNNGLDVLASYEDGRARYINQSGKIIVWETTTETSEALTTQLFKDAVNIVRNIGPWDKPRRPYPEKGNARITILTSGEFYFGEGPQDLFFNDSMAGPTLTSAAHLMRYLTEQAVTPKK